VAGSCEYGNEPLGSIKKSGEFIGYQSDYKLLKKDSAPLVNELLGYGKRRVEGKVCPVFKHHAVKTYIEEWRGR
jgi:hypothetical protein